jgi:hypothetical protein
MRKIRFILVLFLLSFPAQPLWAWGKTGHRVIAQVAYDNLNCRARRQVDKILGKHGIVYYANWADEIKSDTIYLNSYDWHYQDFPAGLTYDDIAGALVDYPKEGGNLFRALDSIENVLREQVKQRAVDPYTLRFFIHLNGDLYCPMHLAHLDDKGGNTVKVKWFGQNTNLHAVWDTKLIDSQGYSYSEYADILQKKYADLRKGLLRDDYSQTDLIWQTYRLTSDIYTYQQSWDGNAYHYIYRWHEPMELQLYKAGIRLARVLNKLF